MAEDKCFGCKTGVADGSWYAAGCFCDDCHYTLMDLMDPIPGARQDAEDFHRMAKIAASMAKQSELLSAKAAKGLAKLGAKKGPGVKKAAPRSAKLKKGGKK